jgi:hypothetical protein
LKFHVRGAALSPEFHRKRRTPAVADEGLRSVCVSYSSTAARDSNADTSKMCTMVCRASAYLYWLVGWRDAFHHMTQDSSSADARVLVM